MDCIENKKLLIFGASLAGEKAYRILKSFGFNIKNFVDNDQNKWGTNFNGLDIISPDDLLRFDIESVYIVVASMFHYEISEQLIVYGYKEKDNFCTIEDLILHFIDKNEKKIFDEIESDLIRINNNGDEKIIIALPYGFILGGTETWSIKIFNELNKRNIETYILNLSKEEKDLDIFNIYDIKKILTTPIDYDNYLGSLVDICKIIIALFPVKLIPNSEELCDVGYILKKYINIKIISVIHNDTTYRITQNLRFNQIIDKFICVSEDIKEKLAEKIENRKDDILYKISPINCFAEDKDYSRGDQPLKIGFIGRLVKQQKRCDYLVQLINNFIERNDMKIEFHIIGEGNYKTILEELKKSETNNVRIFIYGKVPHDEINTILRNLDVYLNISDYEGTSLAMLEALSQGVIPIITNVSGVKLFVENKINGLVSDIGDMSSIEKNIEYLYYNRMKLKEFGDICIEKAKKLCSQEEYLSFLCGI